MRHQNPVADSFNTLIENTKAYLSDTAERTINHLLQRDGVYDYPALVAADMSDNIGYDMVGMDEARSNAKREALIRMGRDGILFLLSCSSGVRKLLKAKNLLIASPIILAALALPAAGKAIEKRRNRPVGAIQGGPISPFLSNVYLHEFDKSMISSGLRLVRYADDFVVLCKSEGRAHHAWEVTRRKLRELKLELHSDKTRVMRFSDELKFLGYVFDAEGAYEQKEESALIEAKKTIKDALNSSAETVTQKSHFIVEKGKQLSDAAKEKLKNRRKKLPKATEQNNSDDEGLEEEYPIP